MVLDNLRNKLKPTGLVTRGCFHLSSTEFNGTLALVGNLGGDFWPIFEASGFNGENALDRWTKAMLDPIASDLGAKVFYPFTKPPLPFLTWAQQAEGLQPSPLGLLIHPEYGLWHAYRAAFLFEEFIDLPPTEDVLHPCATCADKPCLSTCPVGAFKVGHYAVDDCRNHVKSEAGTSCRLSGCLARQACPVGKQHQSSETQQRFHMASFLTS